MAYALTFSGYYKYDSRAMGIEVPAVLRAVGNQVKVLAKMDTGAAHCMFERWIGEELGLKIDTGVWLRFETVGGPFEAYGHEISIEVLGIETTAMVYFHENADRRRNVLGRGGWLDRLRIGIVDYEQALYLSHYDK